MDLRIERALEFMEAHCENRLSVQAVARELGLSPSRFEHLFKAYTGTTFRKALRSLRVSAAARLLADPRLRIKGIAFQCGYAHTSNLTREFKRQFGLAPSAYRLQIRLTNSASRKQIRVDAAGVPN